MVVSNVGQKALVLRNDGGNRRSWLEIATVGTRSNRDGIGCARQGRVRIGLTQYFTINTAVGYLSASDKRLIVGLGDEAMARARRDSMAVGTVQKLENVKAGQTIVARTRRAGTVDDQPTRAARPAGVLGASGGLRAGDLHREASSRIRAASRRAAHFNARASPTSRSRPVSCTPIIYGGVDKKTYIVEVVGCGVAFIDYDNDGWLDLFVLNGTRLDGAPRGRRTACTRTTATARSRTSPTRRACSKSGWASAVTVGDYDNDGFDDLFITYYGQNVLYRNNGDGTFTDVTEKAGLRQSEVRYGSGCTWVDYDRDGHLDLFVANYLNTTIEKLPKPGENADCRWKGVPVNCGPRGLPTGFVQLFHNNGDGTFTDVSRESGVAARRVRIR